MNNLQTIFALLLAFEIKHFLCDYPLQTQHMLKKGGRVGWVTPLFEHASCHATITYLISVVYVIITNGSFATVLIVGTIDLSTHFVIDRLKAHPHLGGRYEHTDPKFWWCLGGDQLAHHLVQFWIVWILVS